MYSKEKKREYYHQYYILNKKKIDTQNKKWRCNNPDKIKESQQIWSKNNKESLRIYHKKWNEDNKERISKQKKEYKKENREQIKKQRDQYRQSNRKKVLERGRELDRQIKIDVLNHYDNSICKRCGETNLYKLTLDHIEGDGKKHRERLGNGKHFGNRFYRYLKRNNYPNDPSLQVLCLACNARKYQLEEK